MCSAAAATEPGSVTSSTMEAASTPEARRSAAAFSPSSELRAPMTTVWPSAPSWAAISRPMPLLAPVIRITMDSFMAPAHHRRGHAGQHRTRLERYPGGMDAPELRELSYFVAVAE